MHHVPSVIDGKEIDGQSGMLKVVDPGTGEVWAEATECGAAEVDLGT